MDGADYAVLICPGYSCDRQKWRPFADLFVKNGITTMVFDYSGQGASYGSIGFDNAKTDHVPTQIHDALTELHTRSGIDYDHIILLGHSMGGRAILKMLTVESLDLPVANIILLSPEVDYVYSAQASLFAGTLDAEEEPWKSYSEAYTVGHNIYLFGSTGDDIVSAGSVLGLYRHLGGTLTQEKGAVMPNHVEVNGVGSRITLGIVKGVLHSYEMYSGKFASLVNGALEEITGVAPSFPAWRIMTVYFGWLIGLAGIAVLLIGLNRGRAMAAEGVTETLPTLVNAKKFLLWKLFFWLPGLLAAGIICCITVVMPFGSPVMNSVYMCAIAGYGLVMLLCYRKGHFAGTEGKLPKPSFRLHGKTWVVPCLVAVGICAFVVYALRTGMYRLLPLNWRLFWLVFAGVLMTVGYYVSGCEADMLRAAHAGPGVTVLYNLIQYVALFLLVAFYCILKSWSGLIGQVQNMVLMYAFCIPLGNYLRRSTGSRVWGAFITAFVFQAMMITSAALIAMF